MEQSHRQDWSPDVVLPGFDAAVLHFSDDHDGPVVATLIRRRANLSTNRAALYIHGWTDYFFQVHLADEFNAHGYNFYALDLRKYGRSLHGSPHPNYCRDVHEYFPEISAALQIITGQDDNASVVLNAHSTGGLTSALYADHGPERRRINALILNSPFLAFNLNRLDLTMIKTMAGFADVFPFMRLYRNRPVPYIQSIHADHHGEWQFDLRWRPLNAFPVYAGWMGAILDAHKQLRQGLTTHTPILVLHSAKSVTGPEWTPDFQNADSVLNVDHIRQGSRHLGTNVTVREVKDGMHDLILSRADVRAQVFTEMFRWLDGLSRSTAAESFSSQSSRV